MLRKRKERTPGQKKTRFYFALAVIGLMLIFMLIPGKKTEQAEDPVLAALDTMLDTLVRNKFGEGCEILQVQAYQLIDEAKIQVPAPDMSGLPEDSRFAEAIKTEMEQTEEIQKSYVRRIVFLTGGEPRKRITGFQKTDSGLQASVLEYLIEIKEPTNQQ